MIGLILATDMAKHFGELSRFKTRLASNDFAPDAGDKELTLHMIFHLSDISNSLKKFEVCQKWTDLLFNEFFAQGDDERKRGIPISMMMDRTTVNVAKSQKNFIDFLILPAF